MIKKQSVDEKKSFLPFVLVLSVLTGMLCILFFLAINTTGAKAKYVSKTTVSFHASYIDPGEEAVVGNPEEPIEEALMEETPIQEEKL